MMGEGARAWLPDWEVLMTGVDVVDDANSEAGVRVPTPASPTGSTQTLTQQQHHIRGLEGAAARWQPGQSSRMERTWTTLSCERLENGKGLAAEIVVQIVMIAPGPPLIEQAAPGGSVRPRV